MVLTNPPFGKKSSMTFTNEEGEQENKKETYNHRFLGYHPARVRG